MRATSIMRASYTSDIGFDAGEVVVGLRIQPLDEGAQEAPLHEIVAVPREKYGSAVSELFGSTNTFGWLAPLSTAGQPISISQKGFDCGTQSVGVPLSTPPGRFSAR